MSYIDTLKKEELFQIADGVPKETREAIMNASGDQLRATLYYYLLDTEKNSLDDFQKHPEKPLKIQNSSDEDYYKKDGGMLAHLSDQEMRFILLSPGMRKQFEYKGEQNGFVYLEGNKFTPLQALDAKEKTEETITREFRDSIQTQFMTQLENKRKAELDDRSARIPQTDPLEKNRTELVNTLKACEANLNDHTHWYNSSPAYREMQEKMKELREFTETMNMHTDNSFGEHAQENLHDYYQETMKSIQKYLDGKNPEAFKNKYEESRYWTAKATLTKLDQLDKPFRQKQKEEQKEEEKALKEEPLSDYQEAEELSNPSPTKKNFLRLGKTTGDYKDFEDYRNKLANKFRETKANKNDRGYHFLLKKALEAQDTLARISLMGGFTENLNSPSTKIFKDSLKTLFMLEEVEHARQGKETIKFRGKSLEQIMMVPKEKREETFNRLLDNPDLDVGQNFLDNSKIMHNEKKRMELLESIAYRGAASGLYSKIHEVKKAEKTNEQIRKTSVHKKKTEPDINKKHEKGLGMIG